MSSFIQQPNIQEIEYYRSTTAFNTHLYNYSQDIRRRTGQLISAGISAANAAADVVIKDTGRKLIPGIHPGVSVPMISVGFVGASDGHAYSAFIDPTVLGFNGSLGGGPAGPQGEAGPAGPAGATGPAGPAGAQGERGFGLAVHNFITVGVSGEQFTNVAEALTFITDASASNPYVISVSPGIYNENQLTMIPYVSVVGFSSETTILQPNNPNENFIIGADNARIENMTITGATRGALVYHSSPTGTTRSRFAVQKCFLGNADTLVRTHSTTGASTVHVTTCNYGSSYQFNYGFVATNDASGNISRILILQGSTIGMTAPLPAGLALASGPNAEIVMNGHQIRTSALSSGYGVKADNGGLLRLIGTSIRGFAQGILLDASGAPTTIYANGINCQDNTMDLVVEDPDATGFVSGITEYSKISINASSTVFVPNKDLTIILVAKRGGDFSTINDALDFITDNSSTNPYLIRVGPGIFEESQIVCKEYVSITGSGCTQTIVQAANLGEHLVLTIDHIAITALTLTGTGTGYSLIYHDTPGGTTTTNAYINSCILGEADTCNMLWWRRT